MSHLNKLEVLLGLLIGAIISFIFIGIQVLFGRTLNFDRSLGIELSYNMLYAVVLTFINVTFFDYLNHRVVWKKYAKYRLIIGVVGGIVLTLMSILIAVLEMA